MARLMIGWKGIVISMNTIIYYEENARQFADNTRDVDFTSIQNRFLEKIPRTGKILDFGCGSGRDTKYFLEQGYQVTAIDGSKELCRLTQAYTGIPVKQMLFQELRERNVYDGIWACASVLHLPYEELKSVLRKIEQALKEQGVFYVSFKYGTFFGMRNGRYFTDMTEETFAELLSDIDNLWIEEQWISSDVRPGREEEKWLNTILRKRRK